MPRCRKMRCCRALPSDIIYKPIIHPMHELHIVYLQLDEFEAFRLCDGEGLDQTQAGERMGISRGTVQRLLASVRRKVATAMAHHHAIWVVSGTPLPAEPHEPSEHTNA